MKKSPRNKSPQTKLPQKKVLPPDCFPMPDFSIFFQKEIEKIPCPGCWHMPDYFFRKEKPKPPPRKYCPMYPEESECCVDRVVPNFDHIKGLYTKCDYQLEKCAHEQLIRIRTSFKQYGVLLKRELLLQSDLIDRMSELGLRYKQLTRGGVCVKLYPEVVSVPTEATTLCHLKQVRQNIEKSLCRLLLALADIAKEIEELNVRYKRLDLTVDSLFLKGDWRNPSYDAARLLIDDLYELHESFLKQLREAAMLLQPTDLLATKAYRSLVLPKLLLRHEHNIAYLDGYGVCMNMKNGYLKCWQR